MHPLIEMDLMRAIYRDRVRVAEGRRRLKEARRASEAPVEAIVIRKAARADARGLERLAELDEAAVPSGPTLVAEVGGRLVAALPLRADRHSRAVADPFVPSAQIVEMLKLRAARLRIAA